MRKLIVLGLLAAIALALALSQALDPMRQAEAERLSLDARRADMAAAIEQQFDQARVDVMAQGLAELEMERARNEQETRKQEELNKLQLWYEEQRATIQARIDRTRADATRDVVVSVVLGIGGSVFIILAGWGAGHGLRSWLRNRGEIVRPDANGDYGIIVRPEVTIVPSRIPGSYQVSYKPGLLDKVIGYLMWLHQFRAGQSPAPYEPWTRMQLPDFDDRQLEATARHQAAQALTAATRSGASGVPQAASKAAEHLAAGVFGLDTAQRPPTAIYIEDETAIRELAATLHGGE